MTTTQDRGEPAADIPRFAKPLTPYLRSRQEALRIRQALTLYLDSHIIVSANQDSIKDEPSSVSPSHLTLSVPHHHHAVAEVKRTPADVTGLRREYLEALRENLAARKAHDAVVSTVTARRGQKSQDEAAGSMEVVNGELQTYLQLLRDRRRYAKCQVFEHYLDELRSRDVAKSEYFDRAAIWDGQRFSQGELHGSRHVDNGSHTDVDGLVHSLEKAVIRAKAQLDRERRLFEELKAKQLTRTAVPPFAKVTALQRTRDELVDWVEDKLMGVGSEDAASPHTLESGELNSSAQYLEEKKQQIKQQYAAYVDARKRLLEAISTACQSVTVPPPPEQQIQQSTIRDDTTTGAPRLAEALHVLQYASEILLPLSKSQKSMTLQKSYLAGMLANEKSTTLRMLDRVRDESHLIPEYPLLSRQPRFQRAVAALGSRSHPGAASEHVLPEDEMLNLAESWAFASDAARLHEHEYVEERIQAGAEIVEDSRRTLEEVYGVLHQNLDGVTGDGEHPDGQDADHSDLWASEILSNRRSITSKDRRSKGPWYGLHGRVGVL